MQLKKQAHCFISVFSSGNNIENDLWIGMRYDITSTPHVYRWINCEMPTLMIWKEDEPNYQLRDLKQIQTMDQTEVINLRSLLISSC
jgi:hypothetical protein